MSKIISQLSRPVFKRYCNPHRVLYHQINMFPWNLLRLREEGSGPRQRAMLARHMYEEGMKDTRIEIERETGMWWNEVVGPVRSRTKRRRALLVRQCELQCNKDIKENNKRKRDTSDEIEVVDESMEIVIDWTNKRQKYCLGYYTWSNSMNPPLRGLDLMLLCRQRSIPVTHTVNVIRDTILTNTRKLSMLYVIDVTVFSRCCNTYTLVVWPHIVRLLTRFYRHLVTDISYHVGNAMSHSYRFISNVLL